jgi:signal transduction histidine kinase
MELAQLTREPDRLTLGWALPSIVAPGLLMTVWPPPLIDLSTGISLSLLAAIIVAAASLPLLVLVRASVVRVLELAPPEAMRDVVEMSEQRGPMRQRIVRRLLVAVVTPVGFVAVGSALIANAHLRRADERQREETARAVARAAFEQGPGVVAGAGLDDALERAASLGFVGHMNDFAANYRVERKEGGVATLTAPLDQGSVDVRFSGSTVAVFGVPSVIIALLAVLAAWLAGTRLGRALGDDLHSATLGVRLLGTEAVLGGSPRLMAPTRFRAVAELERAIERLAGRFSVFAKAQEHAIRARERAARMRGLFFASVSHDLKTPLNAILGFTELVRDTEMVTPGQVESLTLIERRGRELLALIETILDAARVEAGQLTLIPDPIPLPEIVAQAVEIGKNLASDARVDIVSHLESDLGALYVDRIRMARALGTFVGHAARSATRPVLHLRAVRDRDGGIRIDVEVATDRADIAELELLLDPRRKPGLGRHRGLALGLSVARSVVELHGGSVVVRAEHGQGPAFSITLPEYPVRSPEHLA